MIFGVIKNLFGTGSAKGDEPPLEELSDQALMCRFSEGQEEAFALLFERHHRPLYHFILRSCGQQAIADELVQDVFERVIKAADGYEPTAKFTTWLYTIARHRCIDRARRDGRADVYSLQNKISDGDDASADHQSQLVDEHATAAGVQADRKAFRDRLQQALQTLPEDQREVFLLREISDLKFKEIAAVIDVPVPTVKSRLRYALKKLRQQLEDFRDHRLDDDEVAQMVP